MGIPGSCYKGGSAGLGLVVQGFGVHLSLRLRGFLQQIWDDPYTWHDGTQHALGPGSLWDTVQGLPWHFNSRQKPRKLEASQTLHSRKLY